MDYKKVAEYIKRITGYEREIILIFLRTNKEISNDIIKKYLKSLGVKTVRKEQHRRALKRLLAFLEKDKEKAKRPLTPYGEQLLRELYVDGAGILRIIFSNIPALKIHVYEVENVLDFDKRATLRARKKHTDKRDKAKCTDLNEA